MLALSLTAAETVLLFFLPPRIATPVCLTWIGLIVCFGARGSRLKTCATEMHRRG